VFESESAGSSARLGGKPPVSAKVGNRGRCSRRRRFLWRREEPEEEEEEEAFVLEKVAARRVEEERRLEWCRRRPLRDL